VLEKEFGSEAAYYRGLALLALERGQEAVPFLAEAATAATTDPEPAVALAQVYLALGDKEKAAGAARRALTIAPDSAAARELLESSRGR
jgi:Flp pilus assembly protein TadD